MCGTTDHDDTTPSEAAEAEPAYLVGRDTGQPVLSDPETAPTPLAELARALSAAGVREVECLVGLVQGEQLRIWVVVNRADRSVRQRIHEAEWALLEQHPEQVFAFELVRRQGQPLVEIITFPATADIIAV